MRTSVLISWEPAMNRWIKPEPSSQGRMNHHQIPAVRSMRFLMISQHPPPKPRETLMDSDDDWSQWDDPNLILKTSNNKDNSPDGHHCFNLELVYHQHTSSVFFFFSLQFFIANINTFIWDGFTLTFSVATFSSHPQNNHQDDGHQLVHQSPDVSFCFLLQLLHQFLWMDPIQNQSTTKLLLNKVMKGCDRSVRQRCSSSS